MLVTQLSYLHYNWWKCASFTFQESNKAADDDRELELEIERELEEEMRNNAEMKYKEQQALLMKEKEDVSVPCELIHLN